eukprot:1215040-Pyramimonas_sp.AAC.2
MTDQADAGIAGIGGYILTTDQSVQVPHCTGTVHAPHVAQRHAPLLRRRSEQLFNGGGHRHVGARLPHAHSPQHRQWRHLGGAAHLQHVARVLEAHHQRPRALCARVPAYARYADRLIKATSYKATSPIPYPTSPCQALVRFATRGGGSVHAPVGGGVEGAAPSRRGEGGGQSEGSRRRRQQIHRPHQARRARLHPEPLDAELERHQGGGAAGVDRHRRPRQLQD